MEIIRATEGLSKHDIYNLTRSPEIKKMSDNKGVTINVDAFTIYTDVNGKGDEVTVLSIQGNDGTCYATNSATAIREFEYILDLMAGEDFSIRIVSGLAKSGREFITVTLA